MMTANDVTNALAIFNTVFPAAMAAYHTLYGIFKIAHPDATFEEFNAELLNDSLDVESTSAAWLVAHNYVKDASGKWVKVQGS